MLKKSSIFALAIAVAACGTDDTADTDFAAMEADTQTMATPDPVQPTPRATAELRNAQNEVVGTATLEETGTAVRIDLEITNRGRRRTPVLRVVDAVSGTRGADLGRGGHGRWHRAGSGCCSDRGGAATARSTPQ